MGMRKEIEQLRREIASIRQEANERKIAKRQAQIRKEREERDRRERERAEQEMADRNWPLVRGQIKVFLHKLNKEVLSSEGEVFERIRQIPYHRHSVSGEVSSSWDDCDWWTEVYYLEGCSDAFELKIKGIGSVVVFRPLEIIRYDYSDEHSKHGEPPDRYKHKAPPIDRHKTSLHGGMTISRKKLDGYRNGVVVNSFMKEDYEKIWRQPFCPDNHDGGGHFPSWKSDLCAVVLDLSRSPEEIIPDIENVISGKFVTLYRGVLLDAQDKIHW